MGVIGWSALGLGAWWLFGPKKATVAAPGTPAAPLSSTPIQPATNTVGADEMVAVALASKDANQMRLAAAQLRSQGYPQQATTLEDAALGIQGVSGVTSILKGIGL